MRVSELDDATFDRFTQLVRNHTGILMDSSKRELLSTRISRRMRALGIFDPGEYFELVSKDESPEIQAFINVVTTNLTFFFREAHHFSHLADEVVPKWLNESRRNCLRVWSAGCSDGSEAYSIAITVAEALGGIQADWKVLATDIDTDALNRARAGVYSKKQVAGLSVQLRTRWFEDCSDSQAEKVRIRQCIRDRILFKRLNLLDPWPLRDSVDVIFCRNVAIYFDRECQRDIYTRLIGHLAPGGVLYLGHSESQKSEQSQLVHLGKTTYVKAA